MNEGIHHGVSEKEYHALSWEQGYLSKSVLWPFAQNQFKWKNGPEKKATDAMRWGSLVDCLLLTPSALNRDFAVSTFSDFRTKEARAWRDSETRTVITQDEKDEALKAVEVLRSRKDIAEILKGSQTQVSLIREFGNLKQKARLDILPSGDYLDCLVDLKTTGNLEKVAYTVREFGYHMQAAWYLDLWNKLSGENRDRFLFIFQESSPPYDCGIWEISKDYIEAGKDAYMQALGYWMDWRKTGVIKSPYEHGIITLEKPNYLAEL